MANTQPLSFQFSVLKCAQKTVSAVIYHHHHPDQVAGEERGYHPGGGRIKDPRGPLGLFATTLRLLSYLVLIHIVSIMILNEDSNYDVNCLQDGAEYDSYGNRIRHKKVQLNYNTGYNNQVKTQT